MNMLDLKKFFNEGVIQAAILLSVCGVWVDVGIEPYLPLGESRPGLALSHTHSHNLRNLRRQGAGLLLHPKSGRDGEGGDEDSDATTSRRLLSWVRSLDRMQVPGTELEAWLVQREPEMLPPHTDHQRPLVVQREAPHTDHQRGTPITDHQMDGPPITDHQMDGPPAGRDGEQEEEEELKEVEEVPSPPSPALLSSSELELQWEDLLSILEPPDMEVDGPVTDLLPGDRGYHDASYHDDQQLSPLIGQDVSLQLPGETLTPSDQLDDGPAPGPALWDHHVHCSQRPPSDHLSLLEDPHDEEDLAMDPFRMDLLRPGVPEDGDPMDTGGPQTPPHDHTLPRNSEEGEESDELPNPLGDLLEEAAILDEEAAILDVEAAILDEEEAAILDGISLLDLALEEEETPPLTEEAESHLKPEAVAGRYGYDVSAAEEWENDQGYHSNHQQQDSDSGLSLAFSPASPCASETSSCYSSSSSSSSSSSASSSSSPASSSGRSEEEGRGLSADEEEELGEAVSIKQEEEEVELGAVGGAYGISWLERVGHDHTYNQAGAPPPITDPPAAGQQCGGAAPPSPTHQRSRHAHSARQWSLDERRARQLRIPFSNDDIVNLQVDDFNAMLAGHRLDDQQLSLIRDIRRRGKNKMAAQNCRKRKLDVLLGLEEEVMSLRRRKARLQRHRQEALRELQEMKLRISALYQEVMLQGEAGPLEDMSLAASGHEHPGQQGAVAGLPQDNRRSGRKQRNKK